MAAGAASPAEARVVQPAPAGVSAPATTRGSTSLTSFGYSALELGAEDRGRSIRDFYPERPAPPLPMGHFARAHFIFFKGARLAGSNLAVDDVEVRFVVQPEGTVVEVRRADRGSRARR